MKQERHCRADAVGESRNIRLSAHPLNEVPETYSFEDSKNEHRHLL
jgi:hypothetical protein